jgi:hypothetical protein
VQESECADCPAEGKRGLARSMIEVVNSDTVIETLNVPGMGHAIVGLVAALFDKLITKNVISTGEANVILDDAITLITGRGDTVSTSDALTVIEEIRWQLVTKHASDDA